MSRRSIRRRYEILGVLHEDGPQFVLDLCRRLRRGSGSIYPDLSALELAGLVVGEWVEQPDGRPQRRRYRIATDVEREETRRVDLWIINRLKALRTEAGTA